MTQPGIGGAPEDVVGVQVERERAGDMVRDDGLVHMHGALRRPGRAAGEVQQRHVLAGRSAAIVEVGRGRRHQRRPGRAVPGGVAGRRRSAAHAQARQLVAHRRDLAPVERRGGDEHVAVAELDSRCAHRLGPERREQRAEARCAFLSVPSAAT